jgi:hypothetical protein
VRRRRGRPGPAHRMDRRGAGEGAARALDEGHIRDPRGPLANHRLPLWAVGIFYPPAMHYIAAWRGRAGVSGQRSSPPRLAVPGSG